MINYIEISVFKEDYYEFILKIEFIIQKYQ